MPTKLDILIDCLSSLSIPMENRAQLLGNMSALEAKAGRPGCIQGAHYLREVSPDEAAKLREVVLKTAPQLMAEAKRSVDRMSPAEVKEVHELRRAGAAHALVEYAGQRPPTPSIARPSAKDTLHRLGSLYWPHTYALTHDDLEAAERMVAFSSNHADELQRLWGATEDGQALSLGTARWADQAFPMVQPAGHRYTAALMATQPPKDVPIKPPWKAFVIEVPQNLVFTADQDGRDGQITHVLVLVHDVYPKYIEGDLLSKRDGWTIMALAENGVDLHRYGKTLDVLLADNLDSSADEAAFPNPLNQPLDGRDGRTLVLITRLVLNTCLVMSNPEEVLPVGNHPKGWDRGPGRRTKEPIVRTFRVGKPIQLDCRPALQAYLTGVKRNPLTVQFLVRGHWRNQACGPHMSERRMTWIEPYWKGPEDAPINRRAHILAR